MVSRMPCFCWLAWGGHLDGLAAHGQAIELDVHATEHHFIGGAVVRIHRAATEHGGGGAQFEDFVAAGIGVAEDDLDAGIGERRAAGEGHLVLHQGRRRTQGGAGRAVGQGAVEAPGVDHVLEDALAVVADGHLQGAGDLQLALAFVALVAVAAVGVAHEGLGLALEAGKDVLAPGVAGVHQAQQLVFALLELGGDGLAVGGAEGAVAGLPRQLANTLEHGVHRIQRHLFLVQAVLRRGEVGAVLLQHALLLIQLQEANRGHRVVGRREDAVAGADLFLGAGDIGVVPLQARDAVVVLLEGGNAHGGLRQRKVLIKVSNRLRAT